MVRTAKPDGSALQLIEAAGCAAARGYRGRRTSAGLVPRSAADSELLPLRLPAGQAAPDHQDKFALHPTEVTGTSIWTIVVKIRDGQFANWPVYAAIGVTLEGCMDILGLWAGTGGEGEFHDLRIGRKYLYKRR